MHPFKVVCLVGGWMGGGWKMVCVDARRRSSRVVVVVVVSAFYTPLARVRSLYPLHKCPL